MLARQGKLQPTGRTVAFKAARAAAVEGRSPPAPFESDAPAGLSGGQRMDEDTIGEGLDDVRVGCRWCGKFSSTIYLALCLKPQVARAGRS